MGLTIRVTMRPGYAESLTPAPIQASYSPVWRARTPSKETTSRSGGSSSSRNASTAVAPLDLIAFREAAGRSVGRNLDPHATSTRTDRDSPPLRAISHDQPASASTPPGDGPNRPAAPTRCHLAAIGGHYASANADATRVGDIREAGRELEGSRLLPHQREHQSYAITCP